MKSDFFEVDPTNPEHRERLAQIPPERRGIVRIEHNEVGLPMAITVQIKGSYIRETGEPFITHTRFQEFITELHAKYGLEEKLTSFLAEAITTRVYQMVVIRARQIILGQIANAVLKGVDDGPSPDDNIAG